MLVNWEKRRPIGIKSITINSILFIKIRSKYKGYLFIYTFFRHITLSNFFQINGISNWNEPMFFPLCSHSLARHGKEIILIWQWCSPFRKWTLGARVSGVACHFVMCRHFRVGNLCHDTDSLDSRDIMVAPRGESSRVDSPGTCLQFPAHKDVKPGFKWAAN